MRVRKTIVAAAVTAVTLGMHAGIANADPIHDRIVDFTTESTPAGAVVRTAAGSLAVDNGILKIEAPDGTTVAAVNLKFRVDDFEFPIAADITGRSATLTPRFDIDQAVYQPAAAGDDADAQEQAAFQRVQDTIAAGASVGARLAGIKGGVLGCILGGVTGAAVAGAAIIGLFGSILPAGVLSCLGTIAATAVPGLRAGRLLTSAPVGLMNAVQFFTAAQHSTTGPR